jgi:rhamnogalacturonyl hydrolase YesR
MWHFFAGKMEQTREWKCKLTEGNGIWKWEWKIGSTGGGMANVWEWSKHDKFVDSTDDVNDGKALIAVPVISIVEDQFAGEM